MLVLVNEVIDAAIFSRDNVIVFVVDEPFAILIKSGSLEEPELTDLGTVDKLVLLTH